MPMAKKLTIDHSPVPSRPLAIKEMKLVRLGIWVLKGRWGQGCLPSFCFGILSLPGIGNTGGQIGMPEEPGAQTWVY